MKPFVAVLFALVCVSTSHAQRPVKVKQPRQVVEAYRVCAQFQRLLAQTLDFDHAFEATFTRSPARRREIAIAEGEFGDVDVTRIDDATLIDAYKSRMQIFYLMLPLVSPESKDEEDRFFPPPIKVIFERKAPPSLDEFAAFAAQLKRDAIDLRAHLNQLAARYPSVAERIAKFKTDLSKKAEPPNHVVKPLTAYSRGNVLGVNERYYQIGDYAVIREDGQMRIIGIRFFSRLF